jgi:hypothetical protein
LWSDENASAWNGPIKLFANYTRDMKPVKQEVRPYTRVWNDAKGTSRPVRGLVASLVEKAPFAVSPAQEWIEAKPGDKLQLKVQVKRLRSDFMGDIKLQPLGFPNGLQMAEVNVPAGATEAEVSIAIQNGTPAGDFTIALLAQAQVGFNKDPKASEKPQTLVSLPSRPVTVRVIAPPK